MSVRVSVLGAPAFRRTGGPVGSGVATDGLGDGESEDGEGVTSRDGDALGGVALADVAEAGPSAPRTRAGPAWLRLGHVGVQLAEPRGRGGVRGHPPVAAW